MEILRNEGDEKILYIATYEINGTTLVTIKDGFTILNTKKIVTLDEEAYEAILIDSGVDGNKNTIEELREGVINFIIVLIYISNGILEEHYANGEKDKIPIRDIEYFLDYFKNMQNCSDIFIEAIKRIKGNIRIQNYKKIIIEILSQTL